VEDSYVHTLQKRALVVKTMISWGGGEGKGAQGSKGKTGKRYRV